MKTTMKRLLGLALSLVMVLVLAACGGGSNSAQQGSGTGSTEQGAATGSGRTVAGTELNVRIAAEIPVLNWAAHRYHRRSLPVAQHLRGPGQEHPGRL